MSARGIMSASREVFKNPLTAAPLWHVIDAKGHVVGRVAQMVSRILMGKHKPVFDPSVDAGDYVVVVNAKHAQFTGTKFDNKVYKWHSGYPGGLKKRAVKSMLEKNPTKVLHHAIMGMIPKNRLKSVREKKLKLYTEDQHPHVNQIIAGSNSPVQRNIPVNERYQKHMIINESEEYLVGGRHINLHKTTTGDIHPETIKIPGLLERAKINRKLERMVENGDLKQFYKPKGDKILPETVPYNPEMGTEPGRLPWKSEKQYIERDEGNVMWDWPKPDEKFEDNPEQLGRILTKDEINAIIKREDNFIVEDKYRLIMRLVRVQMARSARLRLPIPKQYIEACRQIPTQFIVDEKDSDKRMREALGILEKGSNDAVFGDFSFGFTERTAEDMKKLPSSAALTAKAGAKPAGKK